MNGISQVVYWDYTFTNRLALPSFESVAIADGFGTVAPYFQGIGGTPADQMRVAMDFPVNRDYTRVYFPTGLTGTIATPTTFSGVVTGQDSGTLAVTFNSGGSINTINTTVAQGAFAGTGTIGTGFSRTKLVLSLAGTPTVTVFRNQYVRGGDIAPIIQIAALGNTTTLQHSFLNGVQMVSLPLRPIGGDLATALGANPSTALIAQFRQDNTIGSDQYLRYPQLPAYQPGYGFWTNFPAVTNNAAGIIGIPSDPVSMRNLSVGLQFGWNQIGPGYNSNVNITSDIQFQYLGGSAVGYADAVSNGWIASGILGYTPLTGYEDVTNPVDVTVFPANIMQAWQGYWIRVLVPEGVTMTFLSPSSRAAQAQRSLARRSTTNVKSGDWRIPMLISDNAGHASAAAIGQSRGASDTYRSAYDISSPPAAPGAASVLQLRLPAKQGDQVNKGAPGDLMADIRPISADGKASWDLAATLPGVRGSYTLTWGSTALLPRGAKLIVIDQTTGSRATMNTSSAYTFTASAGETSRIFHVELTPRSVGRLHVTNVRADLGTRGSLRSTGTSTMTVSYDLSGAAQTTATLSLNGRVIRHLASAGRAAAAGTNQLIWDLKDDAGRSVGTGTYMLQVVAAGDSGEQTRAILPITIVR
jgi:hypothetical protein